MKLRDINQASSTVLDCRIMGHSWVHYNDEDFHRSYGEIVRFKRVEECDRCGTIRWRQIDLDLMKITKRGTQYADGYLLEKGSIRPSRVDAVQVAVRRNR